MEKSVKELLRHGEGSHLEFKRHINSFEKMAKVLTSFANASGGVLLIGVNDDRSIEGIDPEEETYMVEHAAAFYAQPEVPVKIEVAEHEDKQILVITVPESSAKPHACCGVTGEWRVYLRTGNQCLMASAEMVKMLKYQEEAENETRKPTPNEQLLFEYLGKKNKITVTEYAKLINVSKRRASRILYELTSSGAIFQHSFSDKAVYMLP